MIVRKLKKIIKNGVEYILSFVDLETNQSVDGVKTFLKEPVLPSKTSDATNNATKPATESQVYKKQDKLVSGINIKTVNNESLLGEGNINISGGGDVLVSSQANNILTSGMKIWAGTETDYGNLGTYDSNCLYLTIE